MKQIIPEKSSEKVAKFLKKNSLHKRDFAEMIGVTLSYVYNLIDETVPFSTRGTTIERIATVMDIEPEEFSEYRIPQEPILIDEAIETIKSYIKENVLFNHDTLPIGEFAIGTNTTAYVMANKYNIVDKLPILIVEKMGPHFAVGDTCYTWAEDIAVFNPDGKEIISRDNEITLQRKTEPEKAYFN